MSNVHFVFYPHIFGDIGIVSDRFVCILHITEWSHISLGAHVWLKGPNLEIHLPFCFFRLGVPQRWRDFRDGVQADLDWFRRRHERSLQLRKKL